MVRVPVLTPSLSSLWLGLVTPAHARVGRELVAGLRTPTVVTDDRALREFPYVRPMGLVDAVERALEREDREFAETRWPDAISSAGSDPALFGSYGGVRRGRRLVDTRQMELDVPPAQAFEPIRRIGGRTGAGTSENGLSAPGPGAGRRRRR